MVQIPDSAKPYADGLVKYHFWILAAIVPFVLLPSVFSANDSLRQRISSQKSAIDSHVSALRGIQNEPDHPNAAWVQQLDRRTTTIRDSILQEWERFWTSQQPLRVWPGELGPDFLTEIEAVEQGRQERLPSRLLQRYQNDISRVVRKLPARMGSKELMSGAEAGGGLMPGRGGRPGAGRAVVEEDLDSPEASLHLDPLVWRSEDQKRLLTSFTWLREPSTTQVRLAQEELWVYGLFCDTIRKLNDGAKGAFDATITSVEELAVGYPAAEEVPGGQGGVRIMWKTDPKATAMGGGEGDGMPPQDPGMDSGPTSGPLARPSNPRFDPSGSEASGGFTSGRGAVPPPVEAMPGEEGEEESKPVAPEDGLREWIYVDLKGRPLTAAALKTAQDATMVHLVPFTLRVVIDQRKVDRLLQDLAENAIPIDVRQVRINPSNQSGPQSGLMDLSDGARFEGAESGGRRKRPYDVTVELRGSVGLATPPDEKPLGGAAPGGDDQGEGP